VSILIALGIALVSGLTVFFERASDPAQFEVRYERSYKDIDRCVGSGLEFRIRFKVKTCEKYRGSYRACEDERTFNHFLRFEPLPSLYVLSFDELGDTLPPEEQTFSDRKDALAAALNLRAKSLSLEALKPEMIERSSPALVARADSYCKGEYSRSLARITQVLTFGALNFGEDSTGWVMFDARAIPVR
jgi:hypothetical protein